MSGGLWSILGVVIGFGLAELTQWFKVRRIEQSLRAGLVAELKAIVRMIPHKVHVISQAEAVLDSSRIMNTSSTHFPDHVYHRILETAPSLLSGTERDCLHILYERLRITDQMMDGLEGRFHHISETHTIEMAVRGTAGALDDVKAGLTHSGDLANSAIKGNPIDVYATGKAT